MSLAIASRVHLPEPSYLVDQLIHFDSKDHSVYDFESAVSKGIRHKWKVRTTITKLLRVLWAGRRGETINSLLYWYRDIKSFRMTRVQVKLYLTKGEVFFLLEYCIASQFLFVLVFVIAPVDKKNWILFPPSHCFFTVGGSLFMSDELPQEQWLITVR